MNKLPIPERIMPQLDYTPKFTTLPMPAPNRLFTPTEDNRDFIINAIQQEQQLKLQNTFNPDNIKRR